MLAGIDVSHFDPDLDYKRAHAEGAAFIVHKASEGTGTDPTYARRAPAIRASGAVPGAYHFLRSSPSAAEQVAHFLSVIGDPAGLLVQLDWELSGSDLAPVSMARAWVAEWHARTGGHPVLIYLPHWVWADHLGSPGGLSGLGPLWASHYLSGSSLTFADAGRIPASWWAGYGGWSRPAILQYAGEAGRVAGSGPADLNVFDGTLADLHLLAETGAAMADYGSLGPPQDVPTWISDHPDILSADIHAAIMHGVSGWGDGSAVWLVGQLTALQNKLDALGAAVDHLTVPPADQVDVDKLAAALRDHLGPDLLAALATQLTK
jgi:GH25 family lysozyme M1 (1,4-beta-N-acetylmuramidase)